MSEAYELGVRLTGEAGAVPDLTGASLSDLAGKAAAAYQVVDQVVGGIARLIDAARGLNDQIAELQQHGVPPAVAEQVGDTASEVGRTVPGVNAADATADTGALRKLFGDRDGSADPWADAKAALAPFEQALSAQVADGSDRGQARSLLLDALGLRGDLIDSNSHRLSRDRLGQELEAIHQILSAGRDGMQPEAVRGVLHQLAPVARTLDDSGEFRAVMTAGLRDADAHQPDPVLAAAGQQVLGGAVSAEFARRMAGLGLIPEGAWKDDDAGRVELNQEAQARLERSMQGGLLDWVQSGLRTALRAHGATSEAQQDVELQALAGDETFRRILTLYAQNSRQGPEAPGIDKTLQVAHDTNIGFNADAVTAAWLNLRQEIGKTASPEMISSLQAATNFFNGLNGTIGNHSGDQEEFKKSSEQWLQSFYVSLSSEADRQSRLPPHGDYGRGSAPPSSDYGGTAFRPGAYRSGGEDGRPLPVVVVNGRDIANGVTDHVARQLDRPDQGANSSDYRTSPYQINLGP